MDLGLDGKVALIAGGSSGIGLAIAAELAAEGASVAIGARDRGRLASAERTLKEAAAGRPPVSGAPVSGASVSGASVSGASVSGAPVSGASVGGATVGGAEPAELAPGGRVHASSVDITDLDAARDWVDTVAAELGGLHVVVVSGGSPPFGLASGFGPADYQAAIGQVLIPAVNLAMAALPHLRSAGWGRLLFVASETACQPVAPLALSGVTRAALVRFAQGLAADVGQHAITVNVLAPGGTRTPPMEAMAGRLAAAADGDEAAALAAMGHHSAVGRLARPDEVAAMAAFLASERASYITGAVHLIDGGASVQGADLPYLAAARRGTNPGT